MAGGMWRALARRMINKQLAAGVHQADDKKKLDPSRMAKNRPFYQVWEDTVGRRRQALAS